MFTYFMQNVAFFCLRIRILAIFIGKAKSGLKTPALKDKRMFFARSAECGNERCTGMQLILKFVFQVQI
jgi:hypothetical protein